MLVLSRRPEEQILLPTVPVRIKIISANGGLVRLGFEAPAGVPILRQELTRDERSLALGSIDDEVHSSPRQALRTRLNALTQHVSLLRSQLVEGDPVVFETLDGIEEELQALRRAMRGSNRKTAIA